MYDHNYYYDEIKLIIVYIVFKFSLFFPLIRVVWVFGNAVPYPVLDVTPTHLSNGVLATLRQADYVAHSILKYTGD